MVFSDGIAADVRIYIPEKGIDNSNLLLKEMN